MRVADVLIAKRNEIAFCPVPKIFNKRVDGHEAWGAIRSAELGDGMVETRSIPETLDAIASHHIGRVANAHTVEP